MWYASEGWLKRDGRRGRLSYLFATLASGAIGAAVMVGPWLLGVWRWGEIKAFPYGYLFPIALISFAAGLMLIYAGFCIMAQRLRDIGLPVLPVLLGFVAYCALVSLIAPPSDGQFSLLSLLPPLDTSGRGCSTSPCRC